jgi:chromate transporter
MISRNKLEQVTELKKLELKKPADCSELFWVNTRLALRGFGGVLPWAHRVYVQEQQWLDEAEFAELLALSQVAPGPNVVNLSIAMGDRYFGFRGAIASFFGMLSLPMITVFALAWLYAEQGQAAWMRAVLDGMAPVAAGLILGMAAKLCLAMYKAHDIKRALLWLSVGALTFVATFALKFPVAQVVLVMAPICIALAWFFRPAP